MVSVVRRGELLRLVDRTWQRCWLKMYTDRAVDHNQSKVFDVAAVQTVAKTGESTQLYPQFFIETTSGHRVTFQAPSEIECNEWIRCITDTKRINLASSGRILFQQAHVLPIASCTDRFVRFDDSDISDSEEDGSYDNGTCRDGGNSPPKSPAKSPVAREKGGQFTIVHGYIDLPDSSRIIVAIPYEASSLSRLTVAGCKQEILHKLKRKVEHDWPDAAQRIGITKLLTTDDGGSFVLTIPDAIRDIWLSNESKIINVYLNQRYDKSSVVAIAVRLIKEMPSPPLLVRILSTVNKVSDLSQREYTVYKVQVEYNNLFWTIDRRFKQFYRLHDDLLATESYAYRQYLPSLPPRRAITPKKGSFVTKRQQQLEEYLQDLVALPGMADDVRVMSFLGVVSMSRNIDTSNERDKRSVLHVSAIHTCLEYGDIILFKTRFGTSKVQRKLTGSRYDHAAVVVPGSTAGQLCLLESTGEGIQVYSLKTRLMAYGREVSNAIVARRVVALRTPETLAKLQQFVLDVNGNKYSILGILNRRKVDEKEKISNYFCSELVAATLQHLGWIDKSVPPSIFWPGSFAEGGDLESKHLMPSVKLGPELSIDCTIVEVGKAHA